MLIPVLTVMILAVFALLSFAECEWQKDERRERRRVQAIVKAKYPKIY